MKGKFLVAWGYFAEVFLAVVLLLLMHLVLGSDKIHTLCRATASDIAAYFGVVMFASSIGFLWSFYTKADTQFYKWLSDRGADIVYLRSILYCVIMSIVLIFTLVFVNHFNNIPFSYFSVFITLLSIINVTTLVKNVMGIMRLNSLFKQRTRK